MILVLTTVLLRSGSLFFFVRLRAVDKALASRLAMEGVDLLTIKELGGWRSLSMVSCYAHLSPSHRSQAIAGTVSLPRVA